VAISISFEVYPMVGSPTFHSPRRLNRAYLEFAKPHLKSDVVELLANRMEARYLAYVILRAIAVFRPMFAIKLRICLNFFIQ
jgi:hypothetical protein